MPDTVPTSPASSTSDNSFARSKERVATKPDLNSLSPSERSLARLAALFPPEGAETFEETLRREYLEEANSELEDIRYLGYLAVEDGNETYAQVRMIARIKKIHENRIDPDTGRMYGRVLVDAVDVKEYLGYPDEAGNQMMDDAVRMAKEVFR